MASTPDDFWPLTTAQAPLPNGPKPHIPAAWVEAPRRQMFAGRQNSISSGMRGPHATDPAIGQTAQYTTNRVQWGAIRDINAQVAVNGRYVTGAKAQALIATLARNDLMRATAPKSPNEC